MKLQHRITATKAAILTALAVPVTSFAQATAPDVSDVVDNIAAAATPIAAIGGAVLLVIVGIKVFKWVRRAM